MKKLILVLFAVGCFSTIQSQEFKLGAKGGLNFADVSGDIDADGRTGYHIGMVGQVGIGPMFAIQPEILYSAQGTDDTNIDYLNVPILAKFKFLNVLSFDIGPQFGIIVNDDFPDGFDDDINDFDLGGAVGAGVEFGAFFGQLRYNFGFSDIVDGGDAKNRAFQISVGYYIF